MISKFKNVFMAVALLLVLAAPLVVTGSVFAAEENIQGALQCGAGFEIQSDGSCPSQGPSGGIQGLQGILVKAVNIFSLIVGIIAVVMIIVGGLKYITSGGDSGNVSSAKNTIIYAIVGLIIVALAQFIVRFVLDTAAGAVTSSV